jgi:hypothetical protein
MHPLLNAQIPHSDAIANAFDWEAQGKTIDDKYGAGAVPLRAVYEEIAETLRMQDAA